MKWTDITVKTRAEHAEAAQAVVQMVANGIYIEDYTSLLEDVAEIANTDLIERALLEKDREHVVIHAYFCAGNDAEITAFIAERLGELSIPCEISAAETDDADWAEGWKKYYKPFNVGKRLIVRPEWETCEPRGRIILTIEPGLAFGTGTHETTRMCLELLEEYVSEGASVLDVGCGSGILSVAALLLGAERAFAVDVDPAAVKSARENGALNGFSDERLNVTEGNLLDCLSENDKFDLILANITAEPIMSLTPRLAAHMNKNSVFICSGIIDTKLTAVEKSIEENGLKIEKKREENGWAALVARGEQYAEIF